MGHLGDTIVWLTYDKCTQDNNHDTAVNTARHGLSWTVSAPTPVCIDHPGGYDRTSWELHVCASSCLSSLHTALCWPQCAAWQAAEQYLWAAWQMPTDGVWVRPCGSWWPHWLYDRLS